MLCRSQLCVIWIVINVIHVINCYNIDVINTFDAILRKNLNSTLRTDMDHCYLGIKERYSCLIGNSMLSKEGEFYNMLVLKANPEKLVILSFADFAYIELVINLHESLQSLHITNFLFICADEKALKILKHRGIEAILYRNLQINSDEASKFFSDDFDDFLTN